MAFNAGALRSWSKGRLTQVANTTIDQMVKPYANARTKLQKFKATVSTTAHKLTVMRPLNTTTVKTAAAAAQAVVVLTADPGVYMNKRTANNPIATNDYLVFETPDRTFFMVKVHGSTAPVVNSDGSVTVTLVSNVPTGGLAVGAKCWFFGIITDTDPNTAEAHPIFTLPASGVTTETADSGGSLCETINQYEPLICQQDNATAAGTLEYLSGVYGP